jgi:hypothetical protein
MGQNQGYIEELVKGFFVSKHRANGHPTKDSFNWMLPVITLLPLVAALIIVLSNGYDDGREKWAFSVVSAVMAFWLGRRR